jgi:hypothetical protein
MREIIGILNETRQRDISGCRLDLKKRPKRGKVRKVHKVMIGHRGRSELGHTPTLIFRGRGRP